MPSNIAEAAAVAPPHPGSSAIRPLRVLFVANVRLGSGTGMSLHLESLAEALAARGHHVEFLTADETPPSARGRRSSRLLFPIFAAREIRRRIRRGIHYDLIDIHEPSAMPYALARNRSPELPPLVVTSHGIEQRGWEIMSRQWAPSLKSRLVYPATELSQANYALRHADAVACLSSEDCRFAAERLGVPPERVHRLSNGVDDSLLDLEWAPSAEPSILFVGSWLRRKGTRELAGAFGELRRTHRGLRLTMLGSGMPAAAVITEFDTQDREAVDVVSQFDRGALPRYLARDQIFVLPSYFEGMPLSLLEAMAAGLPCVTTETCGMRDIVADRVNGCLVPPGDSASLTRAVAELLGSRQLRTKLGAAAKESARALVWEQVAESWEELFASVAQEKNLRAAAAPPPARPAEPNANLPAPVPGSGRAREQRKSPIRLRALEWTRKNARDCTWEINRDFRSLAPAGPVRVLDLGCGSKPYRSYFPEATAYVGVDLPVAHSANKMEKRADIHADLASLPIASEGFDVAVCTQVLEHVPDPVRVMAEANRVLRPGGLVVVTVPFLSAEHEVPNDFYCFTSYGIREVLGRAGFERIEVKKQFGFWSAIGEMIYWHYHRKVTGTRWEKYWFAVGTTALMRFFHLLSRMDRDDALVLNLFVTARKPGVPRAV